MTTRQSHEDKDEIRVDENRGRSRSRLRLFGGNEREKHTARVNEKMFRDRDGWSGKTRVRVSHLRGIRMRGQTFDSIHKNRGESSVLPSTGTTMKTNRPVSILSPTG